MVCIYCKSETNVINSRYKVRLNTVWRRRSCQKCQAIFSTSETAILEKAISVTKNSGKIEPFYKDKILISIYRSLDHLQQAPLKASALTDTVVAKLQTNKPGPSLSTKDIVQVVTSVLKRFDAAGAIKYQSYQKRLTAAKDIRQSLKET